MNDETDFDSILQEVQQLREENTRLRELAKCKTPGGLTQAQAERMPPVKWVAYDTHQTVVQELEELKKSNEERNDTTHGIHYALRSAIEALHRRLPLTKLTIFLW